MAWGKTSSATDAGFDDAAAPFPAAAIAAAVGNIAVAVLYLASRRCLLLQLRGNTEVVLW